MSHDRVGVPWATTAPPEWAKIDDFSGDYDFLSNFCSVEVIYDGDIYPSVEHAYQAAKTNDEDIRWGIRRARTADMAKRLGRRLVGPDELVPHWDTRKVLVMYGLLTHKFSGDLGDKLLATGDSELVEGNNWHDNFWGDCQCDIQIDCSIYGGENWLGRLLMVVREELK